MVRNWNIEKKNKAGEGEGQTGSFLLVTTVFTKTDRKKKTSFEIDEIMRSER
jgi:hypothetical protein